MWQPPQEEERGWDRDRRQSRGKVKLLHHLNRLYNLLLGSKLDGSQSAFTVWDKMCWWHSPWFALGHVQQSKSQENPGVWLCVHKMEKGLDQHLDVSPTPRKFQRQRDKAKPPQKTHTGHISHLYPFQVTLISTYQHLQSPKPPAPIL